MDKCFACHIYDYWDMKPGDYPHLADKEAGVERREVACSYHEAEFGHSRVTLVAAVLGHKTPIRPGRQGEWGQGGNHSSQQKVPQGQDPTKKFLGSASAPSGLQDPRHQFFG